MAQGARWALASAIAAAVYLVAWIGLEAGAGWSRGDALGLAAAPFSIALAISAWWAALTRAGPGATGDVTIRFGAIPAPLPVLEQRPDLIDRLRRRAGESGVTVIVAVTGMRGVGKTQLAAEYARDRIAAGWPFVAWIDAEFPLQLVGQLASLAALLGLRDADDADGATAAARLRDFLQASTKPGLLVFDNAIDPDDLAPYLPTTGATQVVVTSTTRSFAQYGAVVAVEEFTVDQSVRFLRDATGLEDPDGALAVADELGRLPLALGHAASLITGQELSYATYLDRLSQLPIGAYLARPTGHPYPRGVAAAILLSIDRLRAADSSGLGQAILELLSVLAPTGTSRTALEYALGRPARAWAQAAPVQVDAAIGELVRASLVTVSRSGTVVSSHRLVMRVVRERAAAGRTLEPVLWAATGVLDEMLEASGADAWAGRDRIHELASHVAAVWQATARYRCDAFGEAGRLSRAVLELSVKVLRYLIRVRDPLQVIAMGDQLERTCAQELGADDRVTLGCRAVLAVACRRVGRLDEALALHQTTLAGFERVLGADHPDAIQVRNDLGLTLRAAGRLDEAIEVLTKALQDRADALGHDHPDTLQTLNDLAQTYKRTGRPFDVVEMHAQTLAERERVLGVSHPATMQSMSNLASALCDAGSEQEAISLNERTLAARERALGPEHPDTLQTRNNLGYTLRKAGRLAEAVAMHESTLAVRERVLGTEHPDTLQSRNNLAYAYRKTGREAAAIALYEQTLASRVRTLGPGHLTTQRSSNNLAVAYREAGRPAEAIAMLEQVVSVRTMLLPPDHPDILRARSSLGVAYLKAGRLDAAVTMLSEAAGARARVLGPAHRDTLRTQQALADARRHQQRRLRRWAGLVRRGAAAWIGRIGHRKLPSRPSGQPAAGADGVVRAEPPTNSY